MAISGIGLHSSNQFATRSAGQHALNKDSSVNSKSSNTKSADNNLQSSVINQSNKSDGARTTLLPAVPGSSSTLKSTTSRQDLVEVETSRKRFELQNTGRGEKGQGVNRQLNNSPSNKALQTFIDVADFERKDDLTNLVGIDFYI